MTTSRPELAETKAAVSISDMARMVGLSRQRFHQLMQAGVFPRPKKDRASGRPFFNETGQQQCLEVRRRNCGVNGKVVLFYARRQTNPLFSPQPAKTRPPATAQHADILDGVKALGVGTATAAQVAAAVKEIFPKGTSEADPGEVIRAVFLRLRVKNTAESVGRKD
jgi:hypothetical protein